MNQVKETNINNELIAAHNRMFAAARGINDAASKLRRAGVQVDRQEEDDAASAKYEAADIIAVALNKRGMVMGARRGDFVPAEQVEKI